MRPETPVLKERGLVEQMEEEAREAGLGGGLTGWTRGYWRVGVGPTPICPSHRIELGCRMTLLTTIGSCTLPNPVRVPNNLMAPTVLRPLMEGPSRPWQFFVYLEMSLPPYTEDLPVLHTTGPSHVLLQVGLYYEDLDSEYWGGVAEGEEGEMEVEIENEGQDVSVEL